MRPSVLLRSAATRAADLARRLGAYDLLEPFHSRLVVRRWDSRGRPVPPPSAVKRAVLRRYAAEYGLSTLVETGTYKADTVRALRRDFRRIYSVEVDERLHEQARRRCRGQRNATLLLGDSGIVLPALVEQLTEPALFWLDAHFSGGRTGTTAEETPIRAELVAILDRGVRGHVVLVDDHREFVGRQVDYPPEQQLRETAAAGDYRMVTADDIIRLLPTRSDETP